MKNLNKKIGAMALAGMVVAGGVAVSGVSSFAASSSKVSASSSQQVQLDKKVNFFVKNNGGKIISVNQEENKLESYEKSKCYNRGRSVIVKIPSEIGKHIYDAKCRGYKFVKIKYNDFYYLIALN